MPLAADQTSTITRAEIRQNGVFKSSNKIRNLQAVGEASHDNHLSQLLLCSIHLSTPQIQYLLKTLLINVIQRNLPGHAFAEASAQHRAQEGARQAEKKAACPEYLIRIAS